MKTYDVIVIGAGASGLISALTSSAKYKNVLVLDANTKIGKKLLATGNGKCNLANENINIEHFHGDSKYIKDMLAHFSVDKIKTVFNSIGIFTYTDTEGRMYPKSLQASAIVKALTDALYEKNVQIKLEHEVNSVQKSADNFILTCTNGMQFTCKKLILACGGKASPKFSPLGGGYALAKQLGHSVTDINPVLTKFSCDDKFIAPLSGVRAKCTATLLQGNNAVYTESGEMIFGDKALSGICLFNLTIRATGLKNTKIAFDFIPSDNMQNIYQNVLSLAKNRPQMPASDILNGYLNMKLGYAIIKKCGIANDTKIGTLKTEQIKQICTMAKNIVFDVSVSPVWDNAQVTAGGVPLCEIDINTMQSKKCKNAYIVGEVLNIHGDCGGFNLYWAWVSGIIAGQN